MFAPITERNIGTAAIVVGLLVAVPALGATDFRPFILAGLLVFIGTGLRLEAAIRARSAQHQDTAR